MAFLYVLDPAGGPVRDGHKLVVPRFGKGFAGVALPSVCVKCGSPSTRSVDKTFYWHSPLVYLYVFLLFTFVLLPVVRFIFFAARVLLRGFVPNVWYLLVLFPVMCIVASRMVREGIELNVPFCQTHGLRRRNFLLAAGLLPVAGFILLRSIGLKNDATADIRGVLFILICLACLIVAAIFWNPIGPKRIDVVCGVFTGCSEAFLRNLPVYRLPTPGVQAPSAQRPLLRDLQGTEAPPPPPIQ